MTTTAPKQGMVTSPHYLASEAGLGVLKDGGNAVEACVAVAATLAVVYPHMTSIGGDGFWLVHEPDGSLYSVNACGAAGIQVSPDLYEKAGHSAIPWRGPLAAITTAGTISGWEKALKTSGSTLPLSRLLRDAIQYAEYGVTISKGGADIAAAKDAELSPVYGYSEIFRPGGVPLNVGDTLKQPALAKTLSRLAEAGLRDFYEGGLGGDILTDLAEAGSPLTAEDFTSHSAEKLAPLKASVREADLFNTAPPTQGFTSLLILSLFDRLEPDSAESFAHIHSLVEATKQAFLTYKTIDLGDPDYMTGDAQALLDNAEKLNAMADAIDAEIALPWPQETQTGDTTWFAAADKDGRVVSCIQSTYFEFGSGVVLPKTGITWQNRGASFALAKDGWNTLKPGRKPFHTLNPAVAKFHDGRVLAYGTMGGEGQPQTQAAIFSRYARYGLPLQDAVSAPRWLLGRTWGEESVTLKLESRFEPALFEALKSAGHDVEILGEFTSTMGHAGAICRAPDGTLEGASDPRSDGAVAAW